MSAEFDYELTPDQWEALKALRLPASKRRTQSRFIIDGLVALELATIVNDCPDLTEKGRKVLVRGSSRLWDVAA
jgi:spore maturation protein CgeB